MVATRSSNTVITRSQPGVIIDQCARTTSYTRRRIRLRAGACLTTFFETTTATRLSVCRELGEYLSWRQLTRASLPLLYTYRRLLCPWNRKALASIVAKYVLCLSHLVTKSWTALEAAAFENFSSCCAAHSGAKTMNSLGMTILWLECSFWHICCGSLLVDILLFLLYHILGLSTQDMGVSTGLHLGTRYCG